MNRELWPAALVGLCLVGCDRPARIALDPPRLQLHARAQAGKLHAAPFAKNGRALPDAVCSWTSSDDRVVKVAGPHNEATVTAVGPGSANVRCTIGGVAAEAPVSVRIVSRVDVSPSVVELKLLDRPEPRPLDVRAYDADGGAISGRVPLTRCVDENVCRGDARGQLWAVGTGASSVVVEVDGIRAEVTARVVDARTAAGRPRRVKGNPMLDYEKALRTR